MLVKPYSRQCEFNAAKVALGLADYEQVTGILKGTEGFLQSLKRLLGDDVPPFTQYLAAKAFMKIDPTEAREARLHSVRAFRGRAEVCISMKMYVEALADLDQEVELEESVDDVTLRRRSFVKTKLCDFRGALDDANEAVKMSSGMGRAFCLQERGVLKQIMRDLEGALADFDEGLKIDTDDYERLKHRGYVKFLLNDEEGAHADAEWALRIKPSRVDRHDYGSDGCLGTDPVEYLGYKLK